MIGAVLFPCVIGVEVTLAAEVVVARVTATAVVGATATGVMVVSEKKIDEV